MKTHVSQWLSEIQDWPEIAHRAGYRAHKLALLCGVHRRALERFFKAAFGESPQQWLDVVKHSKLESLLRTDKQLKELAYLTGYKQPSHLSRDFKLRHGMPPSEWRKLAH